ncbi:unnamed protein product [Trichobilharzia regenti]|nr:unnamed protein product [Trichobilharzia regenti]
MYGNGLLVDQRSGREPVSSQWTTLGKLAHNALIKSWQGYPKKRYHSEEVNTLEKLHTFERQRDDYAQFLLSRDNEKLEALIEFIVDVGREVDVAIFDLYPITNESDEFFKTLLATACYKLCILIAKLVKLSNHETNLTRQTLICIVNHWFALCRLHLLRAWLSRQPRWRRMFKTGDEQCSIYYLISRYINVTSSLQSEFEYICFLTKTFEQMTLFLSCKQFETCKLKNSIQIYTQLEDFFMAIRLTSDKYKYVNKAFKNHVLNCITSLEAQTHAVNKEIRHLKNHLKFLFEDSTSPSCACTAQLVYNTDEMTSKSSELVCNSVHCSMKDYLNKVESISGCISLLVLSMIILFFTEVLFFYQWYFAETSEYGGHFLFNAFLIQHNPVMIKTLIIMYCCLAPLVVLINLECRIRLNKMALNYLTKINWRTLRLLVADSDNAGEVGTNIKQSIQHSLCLRIYLIWDMFEFYEAKLFDCASCFRHKMAEHGVCLFTY